MSSSNQASRAENHIRRIREEFGVDRADGQPKPRHVRALERALDILSDRLYQSQAHFLSELIQNADDNEYSADIDHPCLTLTLGDGQLRIHSDERGFSEANVEAICRIGESTKANTADGTTRYIGEMGIGFKSVFKVAHKVWILSRGYAFYFDRNATLGMIAPTWDESKPSPTEGTTMVLELSNDCDESELRRELMALDPRMLIFLRKLRRIKVEFVSEGVATWQTELKRMDGVVHGGLAVQLFRGSDVMRYIVCTYSVDNLPPEERRAHVRRSEVVLAFRIADGDTSVQETEKAYAFLPIRDYGFKFLIQADFLLSASRQEILTCAWNEALRTAIVNSFVHAVRFKHQRYLLHRWPQYLPSGEIPEGFLKPAAGDIKHALIGEPVVLNYNEQLCRPGDLFFVPTEYREDVADGRPPPLLLSPITRRRIVSDSYGEACEPFLKDLGVRTPTFSDFVADVTAVVMLGSANLFQTKSSAWHSMFAWKLLAALRNHDATGSEKEKIRRLPIVPMSDGGWVSPEERGVYLPCRADDSVTVDGIGLRLIDADAAQDSGRASLYDFLGIRTIGRHQLCQYIATIHQRPGRELECFTLHELVAQINFLYQSSYRNHKSQGFWFKNTVGVLIQGDSLYIESPKPYSASHYFGSLPTAGNRFLHGDYIRTIAGNAEDESRFIDWLSENMGLSKYVRVLSFKGSANIEHAIRLSRDFIEIVQTRMQPSWLFLLRDKWRHYSQWLNLSEFYDISEVEALPFDQDQLRKRHDVILSTLGNINVPCLGGGTYPLNKAYLPLPVLREDVVDSVPLLDVPDPGNPLWAPLKCLGLGIGPDLMFYMRCLESISEDSRAGISIPDISRKVGRCLDQVQARYSEDIDLVKTSFRQKFLIPAESARVSSPEFRWMSSGVCLWEGPKCLRHQPLLKNLYPGNATLFREVLGIKDAGPIHLRAEARCFSTGDDLEHLKDFFFEIERRFVNNEPDPVNVAATISTFRIFPIINAGATENPSREYDSLATLGSTISWFVADRKELFDSFVELVPLLAFKVEHVQELKKTFEALGVDALKLSNCAQSRPSRGTFSVSDHPTTIEFRDRISFLLRLIPAAASMQLKQRVAQRLRGLEVYESTNLIQEWSVLPGNGNRIQGRPTASEVVFAVEEESLHIYLAEGYMGRSLTKPDLVRNFADFCDIPNDRRHLLMTALLEDHQLVESVFANNGIGPLDPAIESSEPGENEYVYGNDGSDNETLVGEAPTTTRRPRRSSRTRKTRPNFATAPMGDRSCPHCQAAQDGSAQGIPPGLAAGLAVDLAAGLVVGLATGQTPDPTSRPISPGISIVSGDGFIDSLLGPIKIFSVTNSDAAAQHWFLDDGTAKIPEIDPAIQYRGQEFFSRQLARLMGDQYRPTEHWTSSLRSRAGHAEFTGSKDTHASFTIADSSGTLTRFMMQQQPDLEGWLAKPPTWHFEVETTEGGLESTFYLNNSQVERARTMSTPQGVPRAPTSDILVLIRITNINAEQPTQSLFRDPWAWFLLRRVKIQADTVYKCSVDEAGNTGASSNGNGGA